MTDVLSGPLVTGAHAWSWDAPGRDAHARPWIAPGRDVRPLPTPPTGGHTRAFAPRPLTATLVTAPKEHGHG
ncbi:hypothetical protein [Streptomyces sp. DH10]|uniref:hypothetical protein n=1 Tax=Streptomyces sp. DH10 TaxID=3040121 RepID=UPI00244311D8|nr:hypothetical protein [Streptomyces sp. DH10]MDG9710970.1 hypothetical protein [Streptomyces sp. DH10]